MVIEESSSLKTPLLNPSKVRHQNKKGTSNTIDTERQFTEALNRRYKKSVLRKLFKKKLQNPPLSK